MLTFVIRAEVSLTLPRAAESVAAHPDNSQLALTPFNAALLSDEAC